MSNDKVQFVVGTPVFVWKKTGVRMGKNGITTSERLNQGYPDIETTEPLMVVTKYGSTKALCHRESRKGQQDYEVTVHLNHVNGKSPYYANRAEKLTAEAKLTPEQEVVKAAVEAEAAMKRLEALKAKAAAIIPASAETETPVEEIVPVTTSEDLDEASSLFETAGL